MKRIVTLLSMLVMLLTMPVIAKADVINGDIYIQSKGYGSNGVVTALMSTETCPTLDMNHTYILTLKADLTIGDGGDLKYHYIGGSYTFVTDNEDNFYEIETSNTQSASSIEFVLYDQDRIKCEYSRASAQINQGNKNTCIYKLKPNTRYYVTISTYNSKEYETSVVQSRVRRIADDVKDTTVGAKKIQDNYGYQFALDGYNDVDYFTYTPNGDKAFYAITYGGMNIPTSKMEVYSSSLERIGTLDTSANEEMTLSVELAANTRYYFKVSSTDEFSIGTYYFNLTKVLDDIKDNPSVATRLSIDKSYTYGIQSTFDRDVFSFNSGKYGAYNIELINNDNNISNSVSFAIQDQNGASVGSSSVNGWARNYVELTSINKNMTYYIFVEGDATKGATYTLKITNIKRSIKYHLNKGKNNPNNKNYYYMCGETKLYSPTRENYKFLGWYTSEDCYEGSEKKIIDDTDMQDLELWAKWEKVSIDKIHDPKAKALSKKKIQVTYGKSSGKISGYEINWSTKKSFPVKKTKTKRTKALKYTIGSLKKKTTYYVRIRPYYKASGVYFYGKGKTIKVKTKKK